MGAEYIGLDAIGWQEMFSTSSGRILAGLVLTTVVLGCLYISFLIGKVVFAHWKGRHQLSGVPLEITRQFGRLKEGTQPLRLPAHTGRNLKTFGVYLGAIADPPTPAQGRLLSQWDIIVVDPLQQGVLSAVYSHCSPVHVLGRLDVQSCLGCSASTANDEVIQSLGIIAQILISRFEFRQRRQTPFHGVLLSHWETHFQPVILNHLVDYINGIGLDVWLEISPPNYSSERQYHGIEMSRIDGIVYRNGTISVDGNPHDYFQMSQMRSTMRAMAAQKPAGGCKFALWETVDDAVIIPHHVLQRTSKWCNYNSTMSWIGPRSALMDDEIAASRTVTKEPLSALVWLRDDTVARAHDHWRLNDTIRQESAGNNTLYGTLDNFVADLAGKLMIVHRTNDLLMESPGTEFTEVDIQFNTEYAHLNPFSVSSDGVDYTGLGCFQLSLECSATDIAELVDAQSSIRKLGLLERLQQEELVRVASELHTQIEAQPANAGSSTEFSSIRELIHLLSSSSSEGNEALRVWVGLHSGFRTRSETQVWGMYELDIITGSMDIYLSNKTTDRTGTILHTFLSSRGFDRFQCLTAEMQLSEASKNISPKWGLPPRWVRDVEGLTPVETLLWIQRLSQSTCHRSSTLAAKVIALCEYQLLEVPNLAQLRRTSSVEYLSGKVTAEQLVQGRLQWYLAQGTSSLEYTSALSLFKEIDTRIEEVFIHQESSVLYQLVEVMDAVLQPCRIDVKADFLSMSIFCALRKLALSEVYLEVIDRNPLPNLHHVQASCFAEFYAVGAQCDAYFDMTPNELGRILFDRLRTYYYRHQPPRQQEGTTELPTTYASLDADLDPNGIQEDTPLYYRITFLGIFAIPALIDITLLTTVGRGLYLSAFMENADKGVATAALMVALLLGGGFGTWITSGGSYYFYSMAFPATSMFVLTRFVAGLAAVSIIGLVTLIGIGSAQGFRLGMIFFIYLVMLTIYLMVLSTLSIYQMSGHQFQSGRVVIVACIPILLISPLLTMWFHHDIIIYPCVLAVFLMVLLFAARRVVSKWNSWYLDIPCVTERQVIDWYQRTYTSETSSGSCEEELPSYFTIRRELWDCVRKERTAKFWSRSTSDPLVQRLAKGYRATTFLLIWYCKYTRTQLPLAYSRTWNLQLNSAIYSLTGMQKGLKLHSAFLHWVHSGQEVWGGLLYFALALMDKWTGLLTGESIVGLSVSSEHYRLAVGFGLAYYLMGAVILDAVSQPLWTLAHEHTGEPVSSFSSLHQGILNDKRVHQSLYWGNLLKYSLLHVWGLAVTSSLMWAFEDARSAIRMYLGYVGAYSGLLWYQYNRIYARHLSDSALAIGTLIAFMTCMLLRVLPAGFSYGGVIGLAAGTWTTAILSFRSTNVGRTQRMAHSNASEVTTYTCSTLEPDPEIPTTTLSYTFDMILSLPPDLRYKLDPFRYHGLEVMQILRSGSQSQKVQLVRAFPQAEVMMSRTAELWELGKIVVEIVSAASLLPSQKERSFRALSKRAGDLLHIIIIMSVGPPWDQLQGKGCAVAEMLVSSTAENYFGLSHDHAMLTELLVHGDANGALPIPEGIRCQLQDSRCAQKEVISGTQKAVLRHLLLGLDIEQEWDLLPGDVRVFLLQRACGQPYRLSTSQVKWIHSRFQQITSTDLVSFMARHDLSASLALIVSHYAQRIAAHDENIGVTSALINSSQERVISSLPSKDETEGRVGFWTSVKEKLLQTYRRFKACIKFTVLSLVADPEYQRELEYMLRTQPLILSWPAKRMLTGMWSFCKVLQDLILPLVLLHGRDKISALYKSMKGQTITIEKHRITLDTLNGPFTCFMHLEPDGFYRLYQYSGRCEQEPSEKENLVAINMYTGDMALRFREEYNQIGDLINKFVYEYAQNAPEPRIKLPIQRQCLVGKLATQAVYYDRRGIVVSGSALKGASRVKFQYWYSKNARSDTELLRAEYTFPNIKIQVAWSTPPPTQSEQLDKWIPYPRVTRARFIQGDNVYNAEWTYDHKFHPTIIATLGGDEISVPPMISEDWFHVLQKPTGYSFLHDDPLALFPAKMGTLSRLLRRNIMQHPVSISQGRTYLWESWKTSSEVDAITARWLDEMILRSSHVLQPYWQRRDRGELGAATDYLNAHGEAILSDVDINQQVSSWVPLAFKFSDLHSFGSGGDARINTRTLSTQLNSSGNELHVLAMDTGTWPNEPGGVSACRRDLVNNLKQIRWHIIAEAANDFGIPRFQVEHNVQSLTILPQWGLDFLHPTHGIFQNCLHSAIVEKAWGTIDIDIRTNFLPVLSTLVRCARMVRLDRIHVKEATQALVDLNAYFESSRSWNDVWMSDTVKQAWRELWLSEDMHGAIPISQWLDAEKPTISQLDNALDMWHRYLFVFSIAVPERIPAVFQASHHFTGATYGVLCKIKRQCVLQVWDHCISFREITAFLSSAVSLDSTFVNNTLISLGHLSCVLIQHHADIILPCAEYFNPGWEIELGTCEGVLQHRRAFSRKIDAVVNGIANMEKYKLTKQTKTATPTVVMLSHVRYVKDIKTAILAADLIVNNWGFHDYRLNIYGDMERSPAYSSECQQMIASKGLRDHVVLKGLGNPLVALEDAWLFMNSSISEGLPLAMGEAALTGVPVVCTDVGASFCVVTDRASGKKFSEVVAPNDPISLAGAQIRVLALLGQWATFAEDEEGHIPPTLSLRPSPEEVRKISQRMYDKSEQRRKLGLLGRSNIYNNFSSDRYFREHEQMLWLGKHRSSGSLACGRSSSAGSRASPKEKLEPSTTLVEATTSDG
ncbi:hypothetical protein BDW59DRAFT_181939 [Aspergillus cavernicola]|uniref:Glycosyl transferase n=1 Tax=Aspergillus cavernicola TaxID=176166 RepID=A0ABR4HRZ9_9EURO